VIAAAQLRNALPHRYPMLLVDRVTTDAGCGELTAIKAVTCNEPWYADIPDELGEEAYDYPAVLVLESWCQAAGVLAAQAAARGSRVMLFGGVSNVRFSGRVRPGDTLEHRVRQLLALDSTAVFEGECLVGPQLVMTVGRLVIASRPQAELRDQVAMARAGADLDG
jgi:3-hydroxyacyl-[acyl-carrier-protein] dehydratase